MNPTNTSAGRLHDTQLAFDGVAADYDGARGNNALIRQMRRTMWETVADSFSPGARLLDLGCGTGLDAAYLGSRGYRVVAIDSSSAMIGKAAERIRRAGLETRVSTCHLGIHELDRLEAGPFDGMYSNLGALNCVPDLEPMSGAFARLLSPGGKFIASVIGRYCPWEMAFYLFRGRPGRAAVRLKRGMTPVRLADGTVWTRYYAPREFYRRFEYDFDLSHYHAMALFSPPPYLIALHRKARPLCDALTHLDIRLGGLPLLRNGGDHFLMVLKKRD